MTENKSKPWIKVLGGVAALVALCCCLFLLLSLWAISQQPVAPVDLPAPDSPPAAQPLESAATPALEASGVGVVGAEVPQGGLGDEELRADIWANMKTAAALIDCQKPDAGKTVISVTQPRAQGRWQERWSVDCGDGWIATFLVDYAAAAGGGTNFQISFAK